MKFFPKYCHLSNPATIISLWGTSILTYLKTTNTAHRSRKISCAMASRQLFQHRHIINPTAKSIFITYNTSIIAPSLRDKKPSITVKYDFNNSNLEKLRNALTT